MLRLLCGAATGLGIFAGGAGAQETQDNILLSPVVVRAAQPGGGTDAPVQEGTTTRIDGQLLDKRQVEDFADIGRRIDAGVNFDRNSKSINLRGLQDNRVLTTVDGIRVPWLADPRGSAQGGLNAFDFSGLSALDIMRGADSSRYGSGALAGVVQLRTLDPEDLIEEGRNFGGIVKGGYDSADESWRSNAAVAARAGDTWMLVQGGYRAGHETDNFGTIGGYGSARTEANPRDYDQKNFLAKLHHYVEGGHRFGITGEYSDRDDDIDNMRGSTTSYVPGSLKSGEGIERRRISGEYRYESPDKAGPIDAANVTVYWTDQKLNNTTDGIRLPDSRSFIIPGDPFFYGRPTGAYLRDNWIKQESLGISGDAESDIVLGGVPHTLRFGGEIYGQKTTQFSSGTDNCPDVDWTMIPAPFGPQSCRFLHTNVADMPDVDSLFFGAFVEDDIKFMDNRLTITPGIRVDSYNHRPKSTAGFEDSPSFDPDFLERNSDVGISPKLRATFEITPELSVFAQWSRGFRAPSARELYQNYFNAGQYARIGNPGLEAETSNGVEVGIGYEAPDFGISANVFVNHYRNFIDEVNLEPTPDFPLLITYENLDRVRIYGAELRGHVQFADYWRGWGSIAFAHGKDRSTGNYLNSVPPLQAIIGLGYEREHWGADISASFAARRDKVSGEGSTRGFEAPGYGVVDMTAWWQPEQVPGLKVSAGIYNLFDKKHWNAVTVPDGTSDAIRDYYSEPGRSFRLQVTQKF